MLDKTSFKFIIGFIAILFASFILFAATAYLQGQEEQSISQTQ